MVSLRLGLRSPFAHGGISKSPGSVRSPGHPVLSWLWLAPIWQTALHFFFFFGVCVIQYLHQSHDSACGWLPLPQYDMSPKFQCLSMHPTLWLIYEAAREGNQSEFPTSESEWESCQPSRNTPHSPLHLAQSSEA